MVAEGDDLVVLHFVLEGAGEGVFVEGVADTEGLCGGDEGGKEGVVDLSVDVDAFYSYAGLVRESVVALG